MRTVDEYLAAKGCIPNARRIHISGRSLSYWNEEEGMEKIGWRLDGTLYNPNGYPEEDVRAAIRGHVAIYLTQLAASAKRGVETRRKRVEKKVYEVAQKILDGAPGLAGRHSCYVCGKGFSDDKSIARGVGPECWQHVMERIEAIRVGDAPAATVWTEMVARDGTAD
jgi:hypothetical protein